MGISGFLQVVEGAVEPVTLLPVEIESMQPSVSCQSGETIIGRDRRMGS